MPSKKETKERLKAKGKKSRKEPSKRKRRPPAAKARTKSYGRGRREMEDPYRIGPVGGSDYGSSFTILEIYKEYIYQDHKLIGTAQNPLRQEGKYIRTAEFDLEFRCCSKYDTSIIAQKQSRDARISVRVTIQDFYDTAKQADSYFKTINKWFNAISEESAERISNTECGDWNTNFQGCNIEITNKKLSGSYE